MFKYKAVFFDFDGVLGDTPEDNYQAWLHALGLHGLSFTREEYFVLEGHRVKDIAAKILAKHDRDTSACEQIAKAKDDYYLKHNNFSFYPGVEQLISTLKELGVKVGCVSGGAYYRLVTDRTQAVLSDLDVIVTADDCKIGKPSGEPYLKAAEKLGLKPEECLVVENAPLGVESAKNAGMQCVAICSTLKAEYLKKADFIVEKFDDLNSILQLGN